MNDTCSVYFSKHALKDLEKVPVHIALKLRVWIDCIVNFGLSATRKIIGYHDEPLHGDRLGIRSIRLNKAYRAIYMVEKDNSINVIKILEVTKHEYRSQR